MLTLIYTKKRALNINDFNYREFARKAVKLANDPDNHELRISSHLPLNVVRAEIAEGFIPNKNVILEIDGIKFRFDKYSSIGDFEGNTFYPDDPMEDMYMRILSVRSFKKQEKIKVDE